jgi:hypothetical protein
MEGVYPGLSGLSAQLADVFRRGGSHVAFTSPFDHRVVQGRGHSTRAHIGVTDEPGPKGDLVIGRHTWKEYIRGLHEGLGSGISSFLSSENSGESMLSISGFARLAGFSALTDEPGPKGDLVIGRHTWKEYIRGLHEGWLGPLDAFGAACGCFPLWWLSRRLHVALRPPCSPRPRPLGSLGSLTNRAPRVTWSSADTPGRNISEACTRAGSARMFSAVVALTSPSRRPSTTV